MAPPRRRIIRPDPSPPLTDARRQQRLDKLRRRLERERKSLDRWMARLRRSFTAVEKQRRTVIRIERQIQKGTIRVVPAPGGGIRIIPQTVGRDDAGVRERSGTDGPRRPSVP